MLRFFVTLAILLMSRDAFAYCRTTTCNDSEEDCAPDDNGCPTVGRQVFWDRELLPIPYAFSARGTSKLDDDKVRAAVNRAVSKWEDVRCDGGGRTTLRFRLLEDIPAEEGLGLAADDEWVNTGEDDPTPPFGLYFRDRTFSKGEAVLAETSLGFTVSSGKVTVARMEINTATTIFKFDPAPNTEEVDFEAVITHEMGHYIGIAHSGEQDSIMAPDYCHWKDRCETKRVGLKRALSKDDRAAVCALYPPVRATLPVTDDARATTAGCAQSRGSGPGAGAAVGLLVVLVAARKRRPFRRSA